MIVLQLYSDNLTKNLVWLNTLLLNAFSNYVFWLCFWSPRGRFDDTYPRTCTSSPVHGSAFCKDHSKIIADLGFPVDLRGFIAKCGANPSKYTKVGKAKVRKTLEGIYANCSSLGERPEEVQGTSYMMDNPDFATATNFEFEKTGCNKDVGENVRLHNYSRGIEQIVGGGGQIEYWSVIYNSEGPAQVTILTTSYQSFATIYVG